MATPVEGEGFEPSLLVAFAVDETFHYQAASTVGLPLRLSDYLPVTHGISICEPRRRLTRELAHTRVRIAGAPW